MPEYRSVLVGNVTDRWTKKGQQQEMDAISSVLTAHGQSGWRLHSVQPIPVFSGFGGQQRGMVLFAVYEKG